MGWHRLDGTNIALMGSSMILVVMGLIACPTKIMCALSSKLLDHPRITPWMSHDEIVAGLRSRGPNKECKPLTQT